MRNLGSRIATTLGVFSVAALGISASGASTVEPVQEPYVVQADQSPAGVVPEVKDKIKKLKLKDQKRVLAGEPLVLNTDAQTGEVLSVSEVPASDLFQTYSVITTSNCSGASGCYDGKVPYASYGFTAIGTGGTVKGSWPGRSGYRAFDRYVSACSTSTCYIKLAPGQINVFYNATATGTSFTVY